MNKYTVILLIGLIMSGFSGLSAQPFADEIAAFKKLDSVSPPKKNSILFAGSSSFRLWADMQRSFAGFQVINRSFGGASLPDMIRYADEIIFPYQPKQIVIYCGENDIAASDTITASIVFARFKELYHLIRKRMPDVPVLFVSIKPSPSRWQYKKVMEASNNLIMRYLHRSKNARFINIWNAMLGKDGKPMSKLFIKDSLHMNERGYAIWQNAIRPYLIKGNK